MTLGNANLNRAKIFAQLQERLLAQRTDIQHGTLGFLQAWSRKLILVSHSIPIVSFGHEWLGLFPAWSLLKGWPMVAGDSFAPRNEDCGDQKPCRFCWRVAGHVEIQQWRNSFRDPDIVSYTTCITAMKEAGIESIASRMSVCFSFLQWNE